MIETVVKLGRRRRCASLGNLADNLPLVVVVALGLWGIQLFGVGSDYWSAVRWGMTSAVKRSIDATALASVMSPNIRRQTK